MKPESTEQCNYVLAVLLPAWVIHAEMILKIAYSIAVLTTNENAKLLIVDQDVLSIVCCNFRRLLGRICNAVIVLLVCALVLLHGRNLDFPAVFSTLCYFNIDKEYLIDNVNCMECLRYL